MENKALHQRGCVKVVCGGIVHMKLHIPGGETIERQIGPLTGDELRDATATMERELKGYNKKHQCYTNGYGYSLNDPNTIRMLLDADFSHKKDKTALLDRADLPYVTLLQWGVKQLKADGNWYAFSEDEDGTCVWLHDYILSQRGLRLAKFNSPKMTDCRSENMETVHSVPRLIAANEQISVSQKPSKTGDLFTHVTYEANGDKPRFKFTYQKGGQLISRCVSVRKGDTQGARDEILEFRQQRLEEQEEQEAKNSAFHAAWANHPKIAAELASVRTQTGFIKNTFPPATQTNRMTAGPWLRGSVVKHFDGMWCARWHPKADCFAHCPSEAAALQKLHEVNLKYSGSINAYTTHPAEGTYYRKLRSVLLEGVKGCVMVISDEGPIVDALSAFVWNAKVTARDENDKATMWEPVNLDQNTPWRKAEDVVAFVKFQEVKSGGLAWVSNPRDYFSLVSIKPRSHPYDCRPCTIQCMIKQEQAPQRKNAKDENIASIDSLGYRKLTDWTGERTDISVPSSRWLLQQEALGIDPLAEGPPQVSPMATAAVQAIIGMSSSSKAAPSSAAASSSSAAAMVDDKEEDEDF